MAHRNYGKIHRYGKEEVEGILAGTVVVQEKVDGANTQIWMENGEIHVGSRNRELKADEGFNGFREYVKNHEGINRYLKDYPNDRLYGEWLVRHTIAYNETAYRKFYLFDILRPDDQGGFLDGETLKVVGEQYGMETVPLLGIFINPTIEEIMPFVAKSQFGDRGEGVVLKNLGFVNGFGDLCFAKIVDEAFKEDNGVTFGGNNKHSDTYHEMWVVNKFMTLPRIQKIMDKLQPELDERLDMKHIPRITNTAYHDMLTEEIWEIQARCPAVDFDALGRIAQKKAKQIYVDILRGDISVADATGVADNNNDTESGS
jgi:hypothetical protein